MPEACFQHDPENPRFNALPRVDEVQLVHRSRALWRGGRVRYFFALTFASAEK